ncbi:FACT complex subunit SPT16 [Tanacetum coccineum]
MASKLFKATLTSQSLSLPKEKKIDGDQENEVMQFPVNENMVFLHASLVLLRESERAEEKELVLSENKVNLIRLTDVSFGGYGKKLSGILETHINGFRYSTSNPGECVDILYVNIKHAIFQPADKESITLLDFHLHNHIMVGNKKRKSVQFYVKIEEQQKESLMKTKINVDFQNFMNLVNDHWEKLDLEFDTINIEYNEGKLNMKLSRAIVKTIGDDPQHFIDEARSDSFSNLKARF